MLKCCVVVGAEAVAALYSEAGQPMSARDAVQRIDEASHFWADVSSPAVSDYNRHQITRDLPLTFFPGARSISPTPQRVPGTSVVPLLNSSKNSWGQTRPDRVGFVKGRDLPGPRTVMAVAPRNHSVKARLGSRRRFVSRVLVRGAPTPSVRITT